MEKLDVQKRQCFLCTGNLQEGQSPSFILIQPVDENDLTVLESEVEKIASLSPHPFCLAALKIEDWNRELTPWDAPPVFGRDPFGHGAAATLTFVCQKLVPAVSTQYVGSFSGRDSGKPPRLVLGGYSLAGFFALWAGYQTDLFPSIAAASPSVWFPGWMDYIRNHRPEAESIYLSLGDREEKTRNRTMAAVGASIRSQYALLREQLGDDSCTLEWNEGNHFKDSDLRCAQAFAWCMNRLSSC